jgi:predicted TIM-barrel fold metal-dependent hydrolase
MDERPLVIVSADCHIGPRLVEDLRDYCPSALLDAFDDYVASDQRSRGTYMVRDDVPQDDEADEREAADAGLSPWRNRWTAGHHDPTARRRDLDFEGVAAEVMFHGSQNDQPIPFQTSMLGPPADPLLSAAGIRIYNRWLADMCTARPRRHVGLAHVPAWDVEAAVAELRWARDAGLTAVNFPAPRPWLLPYNDQRWEPFWATAAELRMPLSTHSGAGDPNVFTGPELVPLMQVESGGWLCRRAAHLLIFAGVFERHPDLTLVLTEQPGSWWSSLCNELDSVHMVNIRHNRAFRNQVPKPPSEYLHRNVYVGASFLSRSEALAAIEGGYADRIMWGSDYPHMESTFQYSGSDDPAGQISYGKLAIRFTFAGLDETHVRGMLGETAATVYELDIAELREIARAIDAPTFEEVSEPLDAVPAGASVLAFRTFGPWA